MHKPPLLHRSIFTIKGVDIISERRLELNVNEIIWRHTHMEALPYDRIMLL